MTQQAIRQTALMVLTSTCMVMVILAVATGLDVDPGKILGQVVPLAIVCAGSLTFLLMNPFDIRS